MATRSTYTAKVASKIATHVSTHLFKTNFGWVGFAWTDAGLCRLSFPMPSKAAAALLITRQFENAKQAKVLPEWVLALASRITDQLAGVAPVKSSKPSKLPPLDFSGVPRFHQAVYRAALKIPRGQTLSYMELAAKAGSPSAARAVGQAMARNPMPLLIPCHRVLAADGKLGGFTAPGGLESKTKLLELEGRPSKPQTFHQRGFELEAAIEHLALKDPHLAKLIKRIGPFSLKLRKGGSPFHWLLRSILYQQLNGKAAGTIHERLRALFGGRDPEPDELLEMASERLQGAGVSRQKLAALKDLARAASEGRVPDLKTLKKMSDEDVVSALIPIRGVGRWTVEMLLIFGLGRADILALDDFAIRKSAMILHNLKSMPDRRTLEAIGAPWKPFRSLASWYLWRALD